MNSVPKLIFRDSKCVFSAAAKSVKCHILACHYFMQNKKYNLLYAKSNPTLIINGSIYQFLSC